MFLWLSHIREVKMVRQHQPLRHPADTSSHWPFMFLEAPSAQTELLLLYLNVLPPAPQEPVAPPALGELAVAWPLVQPGGGLEQVAAGGDQQEEEPVAGTGRHVCHVSLSPAGLPSPHVSRRPAYTSNITLCKLLQNYLQIMLSKKALVCNNLKWSEVRVTVQLTDVPRCGSHTTSGLETSRETDTPLQILSSWPGLQAWCLIPTSLRPPHTTGLSSVHTVVLPQNSSL